MTFEEYKRNFRLNLLLNKKDDEIQTVYKHLENIKQCSQLIPSDSIDMIYCRYESDDELYTAFKIYYHNGIVKKITYNCKMHNDMGCVVDWFTDNNLFYNFITSFIKEEYGDDIRKILITD